MTELTLRRSLPVADHRICPAFGTKCQEAGDSSCPEANTAWRLPWNSANGLVCPRRRVEFADGLDRGDMARELAVHLLSDRAGVVGLYGTWGAGKSFVLDLTIEEMLTNPPSGVRPMVCHFQPWRYEPDTSLAPGLISCLERLPEQFPGFNPQLAEETWERWRERGASLRRLVRKVVGGVRTATWAAGVAAQGLPEVVPGQTVVGPVATTMAELLGGSGHGSQGADGTERERTSEQLHEEMARLVDQMRQDAADAEGLGRPKEKFRVVVVVDDLDRCAPDLLVDMLNVLKVHLSVPGCSYLLALDHEAAARAIVGRYRAYLRDDGQDVAYGYRYLEKIVDYEVELSPSLLVEQMAVHAVFGGLDGAQDWRAVRDVVTARVGYQGAGGARIDELMQLPMLRSPRTMLKLVHRFGGALERVWNDEREKSAGRLNKPPLQEDYPFWLLLLTAMYYRLSPESIQEFCAGRGKLAWKDGVDAGSAGDNKFVQEFRAFYLDVFSSRERFEKDLPPTQALEDLYAAVRLG